MNDAFNYVENLSIRSTLAGHTSPKLRPSDKKVPTINVLLNSSLGKEKPVLITALLDSGGSECLISDKIVKKLYIHKDTPKTWSTAAGNFTTIGRTKTQFKFPELREQSIIQWDMHVTNNNMHYDMIIGRDLLSEIGIILDFDMLSISWQGNSIPMHSIVENPKDSYIINDSKQLQNASERIKRILDAKYEPANIEMEIERCTHLQSDEKQLLKQLLHKHYSLFDGGLGKWKGTPYHIDLVPNAHPYHAQAYPIT